jgi:hypothetical protein
MKRPRTMNAKPTAADAKFAEARGIPGYNEGDDDFVAGLDLLATQYVGYRSYGRILEERGDFDGARRMLKRAADVRALVNREWWDPRTSTFFDRVTAHGRMVARGDRPWAAELYWPVADEGAHAEGAVAWLLALAENRATRRRALQPGGPRRGVQPSQPHVLLPGRPERQQHARASTWATRTSTARRSSGSPLRRPAPFTLYGVGRR